MSGSSFDVLFSSLRYRFAIQKKQIKSSLDDTNMCVLESELPFAIDVALRNTNAVRCLFPSLSYRFAIQESATVFPVFDDTKYEMLVSMFCSRV